MKAAAEYVWAVPEKPVSVHLSLDVVERLGFEVMEAFKAVPKRGLEIGGILLGRREVGENGHITVTVEGFEVVECEHRTGPSYVFSEKDIECLEDHLGTVHRKAVGFYRSHTRQGMGLSHADFELFSRYFPEPHQIFLLIKPVPGSPSTATFFFWENDQMQRDQPYLEFPFQAAALASGSYPVVRPEKAAEAARPPAGEVVASLPPTRRKPLDQRWLWIPGAAAAVVLAAILVWPRHHAQAPTTPPAPAKPAASAVAPAPQPVPSLALRVERSGHLLRLTWDRNSAALQSAQSATLWIQDGSQNQQLSLDANQLKNGSVAYWPRTEDVNFRMEVFTPPNSVVESVRALNPPQQPVARIAKPAEEESDEDADRNVARSVPAAPVRAAPAPTPAPPASDKPSPMPVAKVPVVAPSSPPAEHRAPVHTAEKAAAAKAVPARVSAEPAPDSRLGRIVGKIPLFGRLRKPKGGQKYIPPKVVREVLPTIEPQSARKLQAEVPVDVKVYVDRTGRVSYAELLSHAAEEHVQLASAAVYAARRWEFVPAKKDGEPVESEMLLHFRFGSPAVARR